MSRNLGLNPTVSWFEQGGLHWSSLLPLFYKQFSTQTPPDILVVHAGRNYLGKLKKLELVRRTEKDLTQLITDFTNTKIVLSCIAQWRQWRNANPGSHLDFIRNMAGQFPSEVWVEHLLNTLI